MNPEILKEILSIVDNATGVATFVAILFALKGYLVALIGAFITIYIINKIVYPLCQQVGISARIRSRLKIRGGYMSEVEQDYVMELIEMGKEAEKNKEHKYAKIPL